MTYTTESHIKTIADVKAFFHYLVNECRISFHPDDNFTDYVYNNAHIFSDEDAALYNQLMDESFDVCTKTNVDIYDLAYETLIKIKKMHRNGNK